MHGTWHSPIQAPPYSCLHLFGTHLDVRAPKALHSAFERQLAPMPDLHFRCDDPRRSPDLVAQDRHSGKNRCVQA